MDLFKSGRKGTPFYLYTQAHKRNFERELRKTHIFLTQCHIFLPIVHIFYELSLRFFFVPLHDFFNQL